MLQILKRELYILCKDFQQQNRDGTLWMFFLLILVLVILVLTSKKNPRRFQLKISARKKY
ncbi:hypothetical protein T11_5235 [Trichinella zimbabwensis]|uniref:Uncharacterized protein n=1 Tax=Trichinella zimbabwensis TaxID=268475 RepID=A0A0V1GPL0_9BILA|nr:hypothetical protein T11_5235 [Trichinella zimbabwensis]